MARREADIEREQQVLARCRAQEACPPSHKSCWISLRKAAAASAAPASA